MQINSPVLFVEINNFEYVFVAGDKLENDQFNFLFSQKVPLAGVSDKRFTDLNLAIKIIKENIYFIEKKIDCIFKDVILIIDNFDCSLINFSGFKKLNGSKLEKDNITYILNSLKSKILEIENSKTILHILNSKYILDKKEINNLPIGLFGNFYSQEMSFFLVDSNQLKNLKHVFDKCNLRVKKLISKNFLLGTKIVNDHNELETFFKIEIFEDSIDIIFFENSALRFFQKFTFGTNLIVSDISKVIALKNEIVKNILLKSSFSKDNIKNDFIEEEFFNSQNFRKIKKKLICDIATARIQEFAEITVFKNINLKSFLKINSKFFLKINDAPNIKCFENIYRNSFSNNNLYELNLLTNYAQHEIYENAFNLVQYGWKKEAVPIVQEKKSIIKRFFDLFFN
tara:strand:+ start:1166 stop:2362 length:1197 start_codon:yes stop_codon:yes gene_type:complete